jgi:hypothetical protein
MIFVKYLTELMPYSNPSVTVTHIKVPEDYYADWHNFLSRVVTKTKFKIELKKLGAGATFDWTFFDNSKVIDFDD